MAFDDGTQNLIKNLHGTLELLHETIQTQIKATDKQSRIMVKLTRYLLGFTIALFVVALFQIVIFIQNRDTNTHTVQKQNYYQQIPAENEPIPVVPTLPQIIKGGNERKHNINLLTS